MPGWGAIQQVYQGLVNYNGTSSTDFVGVLARSWTASFDPTTGFESYAFSLYAGVHFSNGDPYNAYVQWYSFYRSLLLAQGPQFILEQNFYSTNFSNSTPLSYYSPLAYDQAANTTLASDLNSWNFFTPSPSAIRLMSEPYQSFQVINNLTIQLNLGYGYLDSNYTYLLASISAPISYAVDPAWVDANGGVQVATDNDYLTTHTLGTGQFLLKNYNGVVGGGYTLVPYSNYWGKAVAAVEPWNNNLQPANTTVDISFQPTLDVTISDLLDGKVAEASFAYLDPSTIDSLSGKPCVVVQALPTAYGASSGSWWVYLNQSEFPFNNLSVREAIAHAINYTQITQQAFDGYAQQWVGPVPPAYPYYNPQNLPPYAYNLTLAKQEIANSPCAGDACAGLKINYDYLDIGTDWAETAEFFISDLAAIGLTITAVPISLPDLYVEQSRMAGECTSATLANGGPFYMGQEFYTSDYFAPDDWTVNDAYSLGSANECMAGYHNATVDDLIFSAVAESNPANLTADYSAITSAMYYNYTDIWLAVPTAFAVYSPFLHGLVENPMGSAESYAMLFNTEWATGPVALAQYPVAFTETGLPAGSTWSVMLNGIQRNASVPTITFTDPNGTYAFMVGGVTGYAANRTSGMVKVNGTAVTTPITFTLSSGSSSNTILGLPVLEWYLWGGVLALFVALGAILVVKQGRRKPGDSPPPSTRPPPTSRGPGAEPPAGAQ